MPCSLFVCKIWYLMARHQIRHDYATWNLMFFLPKLLDHLLVMFKGSAEECFAACLFLTSLIPYGSCSVSSFSCSWLRMPPHLLSVAQSPSSTLTLPACACSDSPESQGAERQRSPHPTFTLRAPLPLLVGSCSWKTTGVAGSCRGQAVWWEARPSLPAASYSYFPLLPANIQSVTSCPSFTLSFYSLAPPCLLMALYPICVLAPPNLCSSNRKHLPPPTHTH